MPTRTSNIQGSLDDTGGLSMEVIHSTAVDMSTGMTRPCLEFNVWPMGWTQAGVKKVIKADGPVLTLITPEGEGLPWIVKVLQTFVEMGDFRVNT